MGISENDSLRGTWEQAPPRREMVEEIRSLADTARHHRFSIRHNHPDHIDDEVVVTLLLDAWKAGQDHEANTYASELLRRVTMHVKAHVRKNPGWQKLGGGPKTLIENLSSEIVLKILQDSKIPCHAEIAFGEYVYRRCLDETEKLYAKKRSVGMSFDTEDSGPEIITQASDPPGASMLPEELLIELENMFEETDKLTKIRQILERDVPEKPKQAFTFRFFGSRKIWSKNKDEATVSSLMDVSDRTARTYIKQAIDIIKKGLSND